MPICKTKRQCQWSPDLLSRKSSSMSRELRWSNSSIWATVMKSRILTQTIWNIASLKLWEKWRKISAQLLMRRFNRSLVINRGQTVMSSQMALRYRWQALSVRTLERNYSKTKVHLRFQRRTMINRISRLSFKALVEYTKWLLSRSRNQTLKFAVTFSRTWFYQEEPQWWKGSPSV